MAISDPQSRYNDQFIKNLTSKLNVNSVTPQDIGDFS